MKATYLHFVPSARSRAQSIFPCSSTYYHLTTNIMDERAKSPTAMRGFPSSPVPDPSKAQDEGSYFNAFSHLYRHYYSSSDFSLHPDTFLFSLLLLVYQSDTSCKGVSLISRFIVHCALCFWDLYHQNVLGEKPLL